MFCQKCGNPLPENGVCEVCTANTAPAAEPVAPAAEPVVAEVPEVAPAANYNVTQPPVVPMVDPGKQQGTIALILGIVAIVLGSVCSCLFACLGGFIPLVCAIVGIVLGVQAMNKSKQAGFKNTPAMVGMILSIVAIVIILIFIIVNAAVGAAMFASEDLFYYY